MWQAAFFADDPLNGKSAEDDGVVIGTSHHEPLMRAHREWGDGDLGAWNYETNAPAMRRFR